MSLGNRNAKRHETEAARKVAVNAEDFWAFKPGQTVMTVDGFLGTVTAVQDGPVSGTEVYEVTLKNALGGGEYTASQLSAALDRSAAHENTASRDYPELAEILVDRPDPGKYPSSTLGMVASLHEPHDQSSCDHNYVHNAHGQCTNCGAFDGDDSDEPCSAPDCEFQNEYPGHSNAEHGMIEYDREHPEQTDAGQDAQRAMDEAFPGGHPDAWLLDHQSQGPSKYSSLQSEAAYSWGADAAEILSSHASFDEDEEPMVSCQRCGQHKGAESGYHPGNDGPCPNAFEHPEDIAERTYQDLPAEDYCNDDCRYEHALAAANGEVSNTSLHVSEDPNAHLPTPGLGLNENGPYREPGHRQSGDYVVRDTTGLCRNCLTPLALSAHAGEGGKPGVCENGHLTWGGVCPACRGADVNDNAMVVNPGDHKPQNVENVRNASVQTMEQNDAHTHVEPRTVTEDDEFDPYLVTSCPEDGIKVVGDRKSQGVYIDYAQRCHNEAAHPDPRRQRAHMREAHWDGSHCWSCCDQMRVAQPGERASGRIAKRTAAKAWWDLPEYPSGDHWTGADDVAAQFHYENPARGDGCTICGDSDHETPFHVDDALGPRWASMQAATNALADPYALISQANRDEDLRFHVTATWFDVRRKAQRLRAEGRVAITHAEKGYIIASVRGDHGSYESVIMRVPGTQKVGQWDCGCKWATYHWGAPDDTSRFAGRMCSHALALHYEAQTKGLIGRDDARTKRTVTRAASLATDPTPLQILARTLVASGEDREEVALLIRTVASINSPFGEPVPEIPASEPGPTKHRDPNDNPASTGPLSAPDPAAWSQSVPSGLDRMASYDEAIFEPEMTHTAAPLLALLPELAAGAGEALAGGAAAEGGAAAGEAAAEGAGEAGEAAEEGARPKIPHAPHQNQQQNQDPSAPQHQPRPDYGSISTDYDQQYRDDLAARRGTLHEAPEPALPSTDGAAEDEQTWSGYAGDPDPDPRTASLDTEDANWLLSQQPTGPSHYSSIATGTGYAVPADDSANSVGAQGGSVAPGLGLKGTPDDALSPEDSSIQSVGSVADIVARFQATAGARALEAKGGQAGKDAGEIAAAAAAFLQKSAMAEFTPAQQAELINEGENVKAANLDRLQIEGTHYESLEQALANKDGDDEAWLD